MDQRKRRSRGASVVAVSVVAAMCGVADAGIVAVATTGDAAPDGVGAFAGFDEPRVNDLGQVLFGSVFDGMSDDRGVVRSDGTGLTLIARAASPGFISFNGPVLGDTGIAGFKGTFDDGVTLEGIFTGSGGAVTEVARIGGTVPGTADTYSGFDSPAINGTGEVAFWGSAVSGSGVFLGSNAPADPVALTGEAPPDADGVYSGFSTVISLNNSGDAAFLAFTSGTAATQGIFRGDGASVVQVARVGQEFETGRKFTFFGSFSTSVGLNDVGQTAFKGFVDETGDGVSDTIGLYVGDGVSVGTVAERGEAAPDGAGTFSNFNNPAINEAGEVAFVALAADSSQMGIFTSTDGGGLNTIVRRGEMVPGATETFNHFGSGAVPNFNDGGQVMFFAQMAGTGGGSADDEGIFLADAQEIIEITRENAPLGGSSVLKDGLEVNNGHDPGGRTGLNNFGQVAFTARLNDGSEGVFLYTPDLVWRNAGSGGWDDSTNWTVGLTPAHVHAVAIDPAAAVTVTGPGAAVTVRSLAVGGLEGGAAELSLTVGGPITTIDGAAVESNGTLSGTGGLVGDLVNRGVVGPGASAGILSVDGGYEQSPSGVLMIELGGTDNSDPVNPEFDQVLVTGGVSLGGRLDAGLIGGFTPAYGDTFEVMSFGSRGGTVFDQVDALINTELGMAPLFSDIDLVLRASVPGDVDFNNAVNVADLAVFALNFGTTPGVGNWGLGDFNGDGAVTVADLSLLALNFGFSFGISDASGLSLDAVAALGGIDLSAVPEPGVLGVVGVGGLIVGRRHRRVVG